MTVAINKIYDEYYGNGQYFKVSKSPDMYVNSDFITIVKPVDVKDTNGDELHLTHIVICAYGTTFNVYTAMEPAKILSQMEERK